MPWEVTIRHSKDKTLGVRDDVVNRISKAIPGMKWIEEPSLLERIKSMPDHPFHSLIPTWPEETRASLSRSQLLGDFEADEFSVQLYGFESKRLKAVHLEIRGEGNPLPLIAAICVPNGWIAVDDSTSQPLDLGSEAASGWDKFREYRDRVIRDHVEEK